MNTELLDI